MVSSVDNPEKASIKYLIPSLTGKIQGIYSFGKEEFWGKMGNHSMKIGA